MFRLAYKPVLKASVLTAGVGACAYLYVKPANALTEAEHGLHAPNYPWTQNGLTSTFDHQSIRRGYQVYREVCSTCHSLDFVKWLDLVGVSHTSSEARAMAAEFEYDDEPDDEGNPRKRPGKLLDKMPAPYPNEQAARAANQGALPPDLSLMTKARHNGVNYVFALLTGYPEEPPAGAQVASGMNYNPYFPGGGIGMARVLYDDLVEYEDGTPATTSQMAKDVTTFLNWSASPEQDDRKRMGLKALIVIATMFGLSIAVKQYKWANIWTRKVVWKGPGSPKQ
ncbi:ubiquinol--cytochrome-c reductase catalytic subunit [Starmerella bacillaris]|uniref:quinol--cytochrome-c reductase n=1 Tax=Starmerella bacillaris TaxID=1247836 RepID=A0AAV5RCJ0_STABA|nr:ubiquinol--cytochrome-c reductase catalytic subunit [Starmerella bacillaris]